MNSSASADSPVPPKGESGAASSPSKDPAVSAELQAVLRVAPVGIGLSRNRIILQVNQALADLLGYRIEEMIGQNTRLLYLTEEDYREAGRMKAQPTENLVGCTRWRAKDGTPVDVQVSVSPLDPADPSRGAVFAVVDLRERLRSEAALRGSEERFRRLIEASPVPILVARQGLLEYTNPSFARMLGVDHPRELLGRPLLDLVAPSDRARVARIATSRLRGEPVPNEYQAMGLRRDGTTFPYEITVTTVDLADGPVQLAYVRDLTAQREAEEALHSAHQRLLDTIEMLPDATFIIDPRKRVIAWNRACERLTGVPKEEVLGRGEGAYARPFYGEVRPLLIDLLDLPSEAFESTYKYVKRDGERLYAEAFIQHLNQGRGAHLWGVATPLYDRGGVRFGAIEVIRDVTDLKKAEESLRATQALLQAAVEQSPAGILIADAPEVRIRLVNSAALGIRGPSPHPLTDIPVADHPRHWQTFWPDGRPVAPEDLPLSRAILRGETVTNEEVIIRRADGESRWVLANAAPVRDAHGEVIAGVVVFPDITALKRAEEERRALQAQLIQVQKLEAIGQLAGGVAHDFNNILAAILMHLGLLQQEPGLTQEMCHSLGELEEAAKRAANLTRQLLLFGRRQAMQRQPVDLDSLLGNLLKMLRRLIGEHIGLEMRGHSRSIWVSADPGMLEQVVVNLVVNARDAVAAGGRIAISTEFREFAAANLASHPLGRSGAFVCLTVSDNGCGMDSETRAHIFEPFFTTKAPGQGTGLGLATVYSIVNRHEGWIEVDSRPGQGSTFRVFLPAESGPVESPVTPAPAPTPGGQATILLVEDDSLVRPLAANILRRAGYQVQEARHGVEALALWSADPAKFDLLLSDMIMPEGLTGLDLAERLHRDRPDLPVILMSGYSVTLAETDWKSQPGLGYLAKPFQGPDLLHAVAQGLARR